MALLDVSAAFDDVDNEILLKRLEIPLGLCGNFLSWVGSSSVSDPFVWSMDPLGPHGSLPLYGLPQGSVLGLLLYIINTSEIDALLAATSVLGHLYADDIQAYLQGRSGTLESFFSNFQVSLRICYP